MTPASELPPNVRDPALLLSYVVWPSTTGDERERAFAREFEARRVAQERAAALRRLGGGWLPRSSGS